MSSQYLLAYQGQDRNLYESAQRSFNRVLQDGSGQLKATKSANADASFLRQQIESKAAEAGAKNLFVIRDLSLTGESAKVAWKADQDLIDRRSGRKLALLYLSDGGGQSFKSQNRSGKINNGLFVNPEQAGHALVLDKTRPGFQEDLAEVLANFDRIVRSNGTRVVIDEAYLRRQRAAVGGTGGDDTPIPEGTKAALLRERTVGETPRDSLTASEWAGLS